MNKSLTIERPKTALEVFPMNGYVSLKFIPIESKIILQDKSQEGLALVFIDKIGKDCKIDAEEGDQVLFNERAVLIHYNAEKDKDKRVVVPESAIIAILKPKASKTEVN